MNMTTEAMEFALQEYSRTPTFNGYDPTAAMVVGCFSDEWLRGIRLAAALKLAARTAVVAMRYSA